MNSDLVSSDAISAQRIVPIGELARLVGSLLDRSFPLLWVGGEISNFTRAASGHWYFVLKDRDAQVRCVMFRNRNQNLEWGPREGDRVEARVLVGLYAPRGEFQLQVEQMRRAGAGVLFEAFLRIKAKLEAEGLFEASRKRSLPVHPRAIAIVTSLQAAALRDVLTTLSRRAPHVDILVFPTPVQGEDAPLRIVEAIGAASQHRVANRIDVLLLVRGGGSIEDLWAYNDERVAYAIAAAAIPVVSGVGHETDFTIADFVADLRAPTPTASAELASPDAHALRMRLAERRDAIARAMDRCINVLTQRVDEATRRLRSPAQRLAIARQMLEQRLHRRVRAQDHALWRGRSSLTLSVQRLRAAAPELELLFTRQRRLRERFDTGFGEKMRTATHALVSLRQRLGLLDPKSVLERGYAIALDARGNLVHDAARLRVGERVSVEVARGRFESEVVEISEDVSARD